MGINFYPHHIGDYLRDTAHLNALEDGTYRRLLDLYYASEKPLPLDANWLCKLVRAHTDDERQAVSDILKQFWVKGVAGWTNKRADEEIKKGRVRIKAARNNGKKATQRVSHWVPQQHPSGSQDSQPAGGTPINQYQSHNQNQKEEKSRAPRSRGSRLPPDWQPSEILQAWAAKERPDLALQAVVAKFRDYWAGVPGARGCKLDWDATFRNFLRTERAGAQSAATPDYSRLVNEPN